MEKEDSASGFSAARLAVGETFILLTISLSNHLDAPTEGRGGRSKMTELSSTARHGSRSAPSEATSTGSK